ncbi:MAG TPA: signal peptidase I [Candidatus Hydrogenedentes bacterium]|nr:signal peptidase I [Candidatus Hydrogenedentota bacterium]HIJ73375.1 signal peptidase I [Candidatus Hydrogenedentota bacterium]
MKATGRSCGEKADGKPIARGATSVRLVLIRAARTLVGPWTRENLLGWLRVICFLLVLLWLVVQPFTIPTESMAPTLHGDARFLRGDRVLVNKLAYGPRLPFTNTRLFHLAAPRRWDVVVFRSTDQRTPRRVLIKRVVGLPGEHVQIRDEKVYIDGVLVEPPPQLRDVLCYTTQLEPSEAELKRRTLELGKRNRPHPALNSENRTVQTLYAELDRLAALFDGREVGSLSEPEVDALIAQLSPVSRAVARGALTRETSWMYRLNYGIHPGSVFSVVPRGCYLLLGDNSAHSVDSRLYGWVPNGHILGRAFCIFWPFGRRRDLTGFSTTAWGRLALWGIPALLVVYEALRTQVVVSWRVSGAAAGGSLRKGDRVLINRLAFGLRVPFARRGTILRRAPCRGDVVAYRLGAGAPAIGRVIGLPGDVLPTAGEHGALQSPPREYVVSPGGECEAARVARRNLVGRVCAVWWPINRIHRVGPARTDG